MSSNTPINRQQKERNGTSRLKKTVKTLSTTRKVRKLLRIPPKQPERDPFESSSDEDISNMPSTSSAPDVRPKRVKKYKSEPGVCAYYKYRQRKNGTWVFHPDRVRDAMRLDSPDYYNLKQKKFNTSFWRNKPRKHEIEMFTPEELEAFPPLPEVNIVDMPRVPGEEYKDAFLHLSDVELTDEFKEWKERVKLKRKLDKSMGKRTPRKVTNATYPDYLLLPNEDFTEADWADVQRMALREKNSKNAAKVSIKGMVHEDHGNNGSSQVVNGSLDKNESDISVPHVNAPSDKMLVGVCKTEGKYNRQANGTRCQRSKSTTQGYDNKVSNEKVNGHENDLSAVTVSPKKSAKVCKSPKKYPGLTKRVKCQRPTCSRPDIFHDGVLNKLSLDELQVKSGTSVESKLYGDKKYHLLPYECAVNNRILRVFLHRLAE